MRNWFARRRRFTGQLSEHGAIFLGGGFFEFQRLVLSFSVRCANRIKNLPAPDFSLVDRDLRSLRDR